MDYFAANHSSSSSSPAMSASTASDAISLDSMPPMNEAGLDAFWLNDDSSLLWDLDLEVPQDFQANFINSAKPAVGYSTIAPRITPPTSASPVLSQTSSNALDQVKRSPTAAPMDKVSKRREQNRASQRLFRERKINYVRGIELQLEDLNEKYQDLTVAFNNQTKEKVALLEQIARLTARLASAR